jgi:hypothetical protein
VRFAAQEAFGVMGGIYDAKQEKRRAKFLDQSERPVGQTEVWAGAMRRQWEESQEDLSAPLTVEVGGGEAHSDQYDHWTGSTAYADWYSEQQQEYENNLSRQDAVGLLNKNDLVEAGKWAAENPDEIENAVEEAGLDRPKREDYDNDDDFDADMNRWIGDYGIYAWTQASEEGREAFSYRVAESFEVDPDVEHAAFQEWVGEEMETDEVHLEPEKWPRDLYRAVASYTVTESKPYRANTVESWSFLQEKASVFGGHLMTQKIPRERVLVFQGARNWKLSEEHSFGATEAEVMVLSDTPFWLRPQLELPFLVGR